jgi:hypothetical protein
MQPDRLSQSKRKRVPDEPVHTEVDDRCSRQRTGSSGMAQLVLCSMSEPGKEAMRRKIVVLIDRWMITFGGQGLYLYPGEAGS